VTLLPGRWRAVLAVLVPLSALGALGLGWWFAGANSAGGWTRRWTNCLVSTGPARAPAVPHLRPGSPTALPLGVLVLRGGRASPRRRWPAVTLAVAGPLTAVLLTEFVLKPLIGRTHDGGLALPAGIPTASPRWPGCSSAVRGR